ncbi:unnamed protein product, partial [Ectocarpus sp. 12 AP-2014]
CANTCADYAYYGTQYGRECWCGNNADYDVYGEATCDMACAGDGTDICGGFVTMSSGYLGCFGDSKAGRVYSVVTGSDSMTTAICADTCADYAYYGTQFGRESCATCCRCVSRGGSDSLGDDRAGAATTPTTPPTEKQRATWRAVEIPLIPAEAST